MEAETVEQWVTTTWTLRPGPLHLPVGTGSVWHACRPRSASLRASPLSPLGDLFWALGELARRRMWRLLLLSQIRTLLFLLGSLLPQTTCFLFCRITQKKKVPNYFVFLNLGEGRGLGQGEKTFGFDLRGWIQDFLSLALRHRAWCALQALVVWC